MDIGCYGSVLVFVFNFYKTFVHVQIIQLRVTLCEIKKKLV